MSKEWNLAAENRVAFADMVDGLDADQAEAPTMCTPWTVHQVAGHLAVFVDLPFPSFMFGLLTAGFNYDKAADRMATKMAERPLSDLAAVLRDKAAKPSAMPMFPEEMTVTDIAVHTQDVRRPLGLDGALSDETVATALDFLTTHKMARNIADPRDLEGISLRATDQEWSWGDGAEVTGAGEALLMAITGRDTFDELAGDGLDRLRSVRG